MRNKAQRRVSIIDEKQDTHQNHHQGQQPHLYVKDSLKDLFVVELVIPDTDFVLTGMPQKRNLLNLSQKGSLH